jgi:hypothetical protein
MLENLNGWMATLFSNLLEVSWINDANDWALAHSAETLVIGVLLVVVWVFLLVVWRVGRKPNTLQAAELSQRNAAFEKRIGVSREDLAEVGLPILAPKQEPVLSAAPVPGSLKDLTNDELIVVARYCMWKGDTEGAREAIAPIMNHGDAVSRRAALALLEGR